MEVIVKTDVTTPYHYVICNGGETGFSYGFFLNIDSSAYWGLTIKNNTQPPNSCVSFSQGIGVATTDIWYYFALSWDGTVNNGTAQKNNNTYSKAPSSAPYGSARNMRISGSTSKEYFWDGIVDEVRISQINRGSGWIETTYNTINDPPNFFSVGPEEFPP
jgi:hypothetical protein